MMNDRDIPSMKATTGEMERKERTVIKFINFLLSFWMRDMTVAQ